MSEGLRLAGQVLGVGLGFPAVAWLLGWSILGRWPYLDREERFAASWGVGFALLAALQFTAFALHAPAALVVLGGAALVLLLASLRRPGGGETSRTDGPSHGLLVAGWALAYLLLVGVQGLFPDYRGSAWYFDWWMHYDEALVFVGARDVMTTWANGYTLASRTPLFNLAAAAALATAGRDFAVFQLAAAAMSCVFPLALYLLLRDLFGRRAAPLALALAPLNLWMLHNAWFTWPKMLAAYYLLLGLHFYLRSVRERPTDRGRGCGAFVAFGLCSLLGFMTHQIGLLYVFPLLLHATVMAVWRGEYRPRVGELAALALAALLVAGTWYGWLAATLGTAKITGSTPVTLGDESAAFRPANVLRWMGKNTYNSVVPWQLFDSLFGGPLDFVNVYRRLIELYFSLLTGAVTVSLTIFLGLWLVRRLVCGKAARPDPPGSAGWGEWAAVWLFALVGFAGGAFLHPGIIDHGIAHAAAFPTALLVTALGWGVLSRASRTARSVVCVGIVVEFLLVFWSHWWLLIRRPEVLEDLPGNAAYKGDTVVFLNERLGSGQYLFLAGVVLVQVLLCLLLVRHGLAVDHPQDS